MFQVLTLKRDLISRTSQGEQAKKWIVFHIRNKTRRLKQQEHIPGG